MPFLPFHSEVNYRQVKDIIKVGFPEVPFTPVKRTYDASTGLILSGDQQCARKAVGAGISFLYASCCVSNKSFPLLGLNTGDLSFSFLFFLPLCFHPFFTVRRLIDGLGWNSAGTNSFDFEMKVSCQLSAHACMCALEFVSACVCVCEKLTKPLEECLDADLSAEWRQQIAATD